LEFVTRKITPAARTVGLADRLLWETWMLAEIGALPEIM
jgi:hypothetical protein